MIVAVVRPHWQEKRGKKRKIFIYLYKKILLEYFSRQTKSNKRAREATTIYATTINPLISVVATLSTGEA